MLPALTAEQFPRSCSKPERLDCDSVYEAQEQYALARQEYRDMPLAKSCRLLAENLAKRAENQRIRDESLATQLAEVVADHPSSNILVLRGFGHKSSLEKALASRNIIFTSVTSHEGLRGFLSDEVIQKIIERGRPTRRELLKALVEQAEIRTRSFQPTQASIRIVRDSIGAMSELQCEKYLRKELNLT